MCFIMYRAGSSDDDNVCMFVCNVYGFMVPGSVICPGYEQHIFSAFILLTRVSQTPPLLIITSLLGDLELSSFS